MRLSEAWEDMVQEDYCLYLESLDPDVSPMGYEAFMWLKLREREEDYAIAFME